MPATDSPEEQILQSRRVLAAWDWMSTLSTRPDEVVQLLQKESRALSTLALEHPANAPAAAQLIAAYRKLVSTIQRQHHLDSGRHGHA
jgi:hypothetical protein